MKKLFSEMLMEAKVKKLGARDLKKILESSDFGYTEAGGNGRVKLKGKNLIVYDSYWAGGESALESLKKSWSPGGHNYEYFKDEGFNIQVVGTDLEMRSKLFKPNGHVAVELAFK